ncbi:hypothetical protein GCM10027280_15230 [Micromonospora polyrhachis]|uniref:Apolipoprotein N-acyltransferase n=1 Tax=Micromonospora polyrhachis TaxID=1282883 RepID=A0A7W7SPJ4_9ACTN|nr:hypothetical protein [Micromonospora polyrhachis]MBB4958589.1 apolipoprotein N-acyltransferase [Micromonospora polyrhachis]
MPVWVLGVATTLLAGLSLLGLVLATRVRPTTPASRSVTRGCAFLFGGFATLSIWVAFDQWDARTHVIRAYSTTEIRYLALLVAFLLSLVGIAMLASPVVSRSRGR